VLYHVCSAHSNYYFETKAKFILTMWFQDAGDGSLATNLFVQKARIGSFRKYSLIAENTVGKTVYGVRLHRG